MFGKTTMKLPIVGLLPAAGFASRMSGVPKFLFPSREIGTSLLERHVSLLSDMADKIVIAHRPESRSFLDSLNLPMHVVTMELETSSMVETVVHMVENNPAELYLLGMPDTDFITSNPYLALRDARGAVNVASWRARESQIRKSGMISIIDNVLAEIVDKPSHSELDSLWGAISFRKEIVGTLKPNMDSLSDWMSVLLSQGLQVQVYPQPGGYYDCGTHAEYLEYIRVVP